VAGNGKNRTREKTRRTCHRDSKAVGTLRCHQDWRCSRPSRLKADPRSDRQWWGIAPGVDGAALRSVRVKKSPVARRLRFGSSQAASGVAVSVHLPFRGTAHGADNGIGPSGQDVQTGRPGSLWSGLLSVIAKRAGQATACALAAYRARASSMMAGKLCSAVSWACLIAFSVTRAAAIC
jgi:hypothetical protein